MNRSVTKQGSLVVSAVFVLVVCSITAPAQTTSFTYQGRLTDGGAPANGTYDLEFKLYDALMNGNLPGTPNTVSRPGVLVTNGGFTVQLDGNEVRSPQVATAFWKFACSVPRPVVTSP